MTSAGNRAWYSLTVFSCDDRMMIISKGKPVFGMFIREVTYVSILIRILAAFALGGIIGMERGMKNRLPACEPICWCAWDPASSC